MVARLHIVEQSPDVSPKRCRNGEPDHRRREYHSPCLAQNELDDIAPCRAERHAHADFLVRLLTTPAHQPNVPIAAHQREPGEQRRDEHRESLRRSTRVPSSTGRTREIS
jgi:hypothetical protein